MFAVRVPNLRKERRRTFRIHRFSFADYLEYLANPSSGLDMYGYSNVVTRTSKENFTLSDNTKMDTAMMHSSNDISYFEYIID